jgi:Enoyl-CoA hydratase/isomerase
MADEVVVDRLGPVTTLTLNRERSANAINVGMALGIAEAIDAFGADESARVLVVTGAGERSFCAGGDLTELLEITDHDQANRAGPLGFARLDPGKPTIAAVNGHCYGGGLELALWCDFRIASANAQFGALNRQWGLTLIDGGTQRLPRIVGYGNAMWMVSTGRTGAPDRARPGARPRRPGSPTSARARRSHRRTPAAGTRCRPTKHRRELRPAAPCRPRVRGRSRTKDHARPRRHPTPHRLPGAARMSHGMGCAVD